MPVASVRPKIVSISSIPFTPVSLPPIVSRSEASFSRFDPLSDRIGASAVTASSAMPLHPQLLVYGLDADFFELVDGYGDVHHLVGVSDCFGDTGENFPVVHLERHTDAQFGEDGGHNFDQFHFIEQAPAADHVHVALVEFAVASFLRTVGPPHRAESGNV